MVSAPRVERLITLLASYPRILPTLTLVKVLQYVVTGEFPDQHHPRAVHSLELGGRCSSSASFLELRHINAQLAYLTTECTHVV
jgi:hypothetical protein